MATLFFGGEAFAPGLRVEGASIQSFLQSRYAGFVREVAKRTPASTRSPDSTS